MTKASVRFRQSSVRRLAINPRHILALCLLLSFDCYSSAQTTPFEKEVAAGIEALKSGDLAAAEKLFSGVLKRGGKVPLVYHNLGVIAQQRGDHRRAVARFREAILLQPDHAPTRLLAGSSLLALGENAEAIRELKRAVEALPDEPQARLQLARAYEAAGDWPGAVREYQKLVELAPR